MIISSQSNGRISREADAALVEGVGVSNCRIYMRGDSPEAEKQTAEETQAISPSREGEGGLENKLPCFCSLEYSEDEKEVRTGTHGKELT